MRAMKHAHKNMDIEELNESFNEVQQGFTNVSLVQFLYITMLYFIWYFDYCKKSTFYQYMTFSQLNITSLLPHMTYL